MTEQFDYIEKHFPDAIRKLFFRMLWLESKVQDHGGGADAHRMLMAETSKMILKMNRKDLRERLPVKAGRVPFKKTYGYIMGSNGAGFGKGWKEFVHERDSFLGDCKATFQKLEKTGQRILKRHIAESLERLDATNPHQSFQRKLKYFDLSYRELMDLIRKNI